MKKGLDNIETYLDKVKDARDALATVGVFLDDEDVVVTILCGLPSKFAAIKTIIRAQYISCSMSKLKSLLQVAEIDIPNAHVFPTPLSPAVAQTSPISSTPTTPTQMPPKVPLGFSSPLTPTATPAPMSL